MINYLKKLIKQLLHGKRLPCYIISRQPFICISYWEDFTANAEIIAASVPRDQPLYFLFQFGWHRETLDRLTDLQDDILRFQRPEYKFIFLTNSPEETELLRSHCIECEFIHQNAFVDEHRYQIINATKKYDAIYIARITPFKRHQLAAEIKKLKLIGDHSPQETNYFETTLQILSHADWQRKVMGCNVSKAICQARTGLCLSDEEGAMFVSIEYLLSGCPVVSTNSKGGRNVFFQPEFAEIVDDTPEAVAAGVENMIARAPSPEIIREQTIRTMMKFRTELIALVQRIYDQEKVSRNFSDEWPKVFVHKFGLRCPAWNIPSRQFINRT